MNVHFSPCPAVAVDVVVVADFAAFVVLFVASCSHFYV
jgi:hypothetical protein